MVKKACVVTQQIQLTKVMSAMRRSLLGNIMLGSMAPSNNYDKSHLESILQEDMTERMSRIDNRVFITRLKTHTTKSLVYHARSRLCNALR